ncbi:hypothetical protein AURDEDRAFT_172039 [Auricularia subglabra TFB-10046 SS5]|nr:hypothetical protein AURDEDRAFT_172039 [Auricularia subglabra TFB-10046 SS5]
MPLAHAVVSAASAASAAFAQYNEQHRSPTRPDFFRHAQSQYQVPNSSPTAKRILSPPNTDVRLAAHCWRTPYADFVDYRLRTLDYDALRITRKVWWRTANELERALDESSIDARRQFWTEGVEPALKDADFLSDGPEPGSAERVRAIVQQYRTYMDFFDAALETWAALQDHLQELNPNQLVADDASSELAGLEAAFLVLTFEREITLIWKSDWTRTKILFLLLRYSTMTTVAFDTFMTLKSSLPQSVCFWDPVFSGIGIVAIIVLVQMILQLRIYAMYERSRKLLYVNGSLFLLEIATTVILMVKLLNDGQYVSAPGWIIGSCYGTHKSYIWMVWIPALMFESYLAALAVAKLLREPAPTWSRGTSLLRLMVRDSVVYFIFIVSTVALNAIMFAVKPIFPGVAISGIVDAASSIGGTRLILSLRTTAWNLPDLSTVDPFSGTQAAEEDVAGLAQEIDRPLRPPTVSLHEMDTMTP